MLQLFVLHFVIAHDTHYVLERSASKFKKMEQKMLTNTYRKLCRTSDKQKDENSWSIMDVKSDESWYMENSWSFATPRVQTTRTVVFGSILETIIN